MFYEQVKALCDAKNIKITGLARSLHLSPSAPNNWKEGSLPKAETIMKIAEYFDVTTDFLLYGNNRTANNTVISASNSAIVQGVSGGNVSVSNVPGLQDNEAELLRIFRILDIKGQTALLMFAYEEEEKKDKKNNA